MSKMTKYIYFELADDIVARTMSKPWQVYASDEHIRLTKCPPMFRFVKIVKFVQFVLDV